MKAYVRWMPKVGVSVGWIGGEFVRCTLTKIHKIKICDKNEAHTNTSVYTHIPRVTNT